jgi:hypothetical protein
MDLDTEIEAAIGAIFPQTSVLPAALFATSAGIESRARDRAQALMRGEVLGVWRGLRLAVGEECRG